MEDLLSLLVVIVSVVSLLNKNAKKQLNKKATEKAFRDIPPVAAPQAVTKQPAAAPQTAMLPPRPEYKPRLFQDEGFGSMEGKTDHRSHISCEGHDPCHEDQLQPAQRPARFAQQETAHTAADTDVSGLDLRFTGNDMVRAFVMQEVLTRPCDRRRRAM